MAYLFCYSLLALPLFVYLRRPEAAVWRERLVRWLQPRGALLALALPILCTEVLLRPFFPDATHALVDDWATFAFNRWFFVYGYVVCTDDRLWRAIKRRRRLSLYAALMATATLYAVYWNGLAVLGVGVVVLEWSLGLWAQFAIVSTASLALSIGLYAGLIRPIPWLRPLFGVKRLGRPYGIGVPAE